MSRTIATSLAVLLGIVLVRSASSEGPAGTGPAGTGPALLTLHSLTCPNALLRGCCDIYCPKPQPCVAHFFCGCRADNYCCKPCPCVPAFRGGCGYCYCPKPYPDLCRPIAADYFVCVPSSVGCNGSDRCSSAAASGPASTVTQPERRD